MTVLQLAAEAGVKRWVLTHKHPDLRIAFEAQRQAANGIPAAYQHLHGKIADLEAANLRLRTDNTELTERIDIYAQVIRDLTITLDTLRTQPEQHDNVRRLPANNRRGQACGPTSTDYNRESSVGAGEPA